MVRRSYSGNAPATTLNGGINASTLTIVVTSATGYPAGGGSGPFFIVIDRGLAAEEKVLIDSVSGSTFTVNASGRGADGTAAATHATGAVVEHVFTKTDADEANDHINTDANDDHSQYHNTARFITAHDVSARHVYGAAFAAPAVATAIGTGAASAGTGADPAREDHVHNHNPPACKMSSSSTTLTNDTETYLLWASEDFDTDSMHSTSTNTSRITFTTAGLYLITGNLTLPTNGTGYRWASIRLNGGAFLVEDSKSSGQVVTGVGHSMAVLYKATAGQYVEMMAKQTTGGNQTPVASSTNFGAVWVGTG